MNLSVHSHVDKEIFSGEQSFYENTHFQIFLCKKKLTVKLL
jgi:hypothetical protein